MSSHNNDGFDLSTFKGKVDWTIGLICFVITVLGAVFVGWWIISFLAPVALVAWPSILKMRLLAVR